MKTTTITSKISLGSLWISGFSLDVVVIASTVYVILVCFVSKNFVYFFLFCLCMCECPFCLSLLWLEFQKKKIHLVKLEIEFQSIDSMMMMFDFFHPLLNKPQVVQFSMLEKRKSALSLLISIENSFCFCFFLITILHRKFCSPIHPFHSFFTHNVCVSSLSFVFYHLISIWVIITITTTHTWHMHTILKNVINQ